MATSRKDDDIESGDRRSLLLNKEEDLEEVENPVIDKIVWIIEQHLKIIDEHWSKYDIKSVPKEQMLTQFQMINAKLHKIWNKYGGQFLKSSNEPTNTAILTTLELEQTKVVQKFNKFATKFEEVNDQKVRFVHDANAHMQTILATLRVLNDTENPVDELTTVSIPDLGWIKTMKEPEMETLAQEWKEMKLLSRINYLYQQLRLLVCPGHVFYADVHHHD